MALEIEGTLAQKLPVQSGNSARGPWAKQEFILEFPDGNFTAKACFTAWGQEKVQDLGKYQVGDKVGTRSRCPSTSRAASTTAAGTTISRSGRSRPPAPQPSPLRPSLLRRRGPRRRPLPGSRLRLPPSRTCPPIPKERKTFRSRQSARCSAGAGPLRAGSFFCEKRRKNRWLFENYYLY